VKRVVDTLPAAAGLDKAANQSHDYSTVGKEKSLPGLTGLTPEQLFFVKWGQSWCENPSPTEALSSLEEDEHSPSGARIKPTLDNSANFKKAFNCPGKKTSV
jgi:endothelin-converting enzyme